MRGDHLALKQPFGAPSRRLHETAIATAVGALVVLLLTVAASGGAKPLIVIGGGLVGLSTLVILARSPGAPERLLLFGMALTLSISIKFHPVFRADHLGGAIGVRVSITEIILGMLVVAGLGHVLRGTWRWPRVDAPLAILSGAWLICATASTLASGDRPLGWFQVLAAAQAMAVGLYLASREWGRRARQAFVAGLLSALLLQSGIAMVQSLRPGGLALGAVGAGEYAGNPTEGLPDVDVGATTIGGEWVYRPTGLLIHPNLLAAYIVLTFPLALAVGLSGRTRWERRLALLAAAGAVAALYLSLSRSGWAGTAAALLIGTFAARYRGLLTVPRAARAMMLAVALVVATGVVWKADRIYLRLTETAGEALEFRRDYALMALRMASDNPVLGVGLNTFVQHAVEYDATGTSRIKAFPVHNAYLLELAEIGFPGGLAFFGLALAMVLAGFRAARRASPEHALVVLALAAGLAGFWFTQLSDYLYRIPIVTTLVWAHLGLALGLARVRPELDA